MSNLEQEIYSEIQKKPVGASSLSEILGVSRQTVHKHLRALVKEHKITKQGSGAHVVYVAVSKKEADSRIEESYTYFLTKLLPKYKKEYTHAIQKWNISFQKNVSTRDFDFMRDSSVLYSSKIEGNTLDLNSYLNSKGLQKKNKPKEAQEIDNLAEAYEQAEGLLLTEKNMLTLHALIGKGFISPTRCGVYRKEPIGVFSNKGIEYLAIEPSLLENEMRVFFEKLHVLSKQNMSVYESFFWASWVHLTFVLIHPFSDGNGRVARLLEKWFLAQHLPATVFYIPTEEWYFNHRAKYYNALKLGVNYWETDFSRATNFISLLPQVLKSR